MTLRVSVLMVILIARPAWTAEPTLTLEQKNELAKKYKALERESDKQEQHGQYAEAAKLCEEMLAIMRQLYPPSEYPDGHVNLAGALANLALQINNLGASRRADELAAESVAIMRRLYLKEQLPGSQLKLAFALEMQAHLLWTHGAHAKALPQMVEAQEIMEHQFPQGHPRLANLYQGLANLLEQVGQHHDAIAYTEKGLAMCRKMFDAEKYPNGTPEIAGALNNLGMRWLHLGEYARAEPLFEEALAMRQRLYPPSKYADGNPKLAESLNDLGYLRGLQGINDKALPLLEQSLAMRRALFPPSKYPDGYRELVHSLNNLGQLLQSMHLYDKALPFQQEALAMQLRLTPPAKFPDGNALLSTCHNNLATLLTRMGDSQKALIHGEEALRIRSKLYPAAKYPDGHLDLAASLNNLGTLLGDIGQFDRAAELHRKAVEMNRRLFPTSKYPLGHPRIAAGLLNQGNLCVRRGDNAGAVNFIRDAQEMSHALVVRELASAPEQDARTLLANVPLARDAFLSASRALPETNALACRIAWDSQAMLARLQERRHATARLAGTEHAGKFNRLREIRQATEQIVIDPRLAAAQREQELRSLADERDRVEADLARALPLLKRWQVQDRWGPDDLIKALPAGVAFVHVVAYKRFDPVADKKLKETDAIAAFVLVRGHSPQRIELSTSQTVSAAVTKWRTAIAARRSDRPEARELRDLVWTKINARLPAGTRTLYLALEGDLARVPWCALPGTKPESVLLEEFAGGIAVVPHGPFLLEQLQAAPKPSDLNAFLGLGDVEYGKDWEALPGTRAELDTVRGLWHNEGRILRKADATVAHLKEELPKASYAHLATHGYFAEDKLTTEQQRAKEQMQRWTLTSDATTQRLIAAKNPLAYVGLAMTSGEKLTGLSIVDLPLENLRLTTLSACETGLGEFTGATGVQGLQQAFHFAGCPNVIASIWNVNDTATPALMARLYHELWAKKRPPIEALRAAQLAIYYHPEHIRALAGDRSAPNWKEAVDARVDEPGPSATGVKRADTKLWAAFVLSGAGK